MCMLSVAIMVTSWGAHVEEELVSEPDPRKNQKEGLGDRLGWSVPYVQNIGTLPIDS